MMAGGSRSAARRACRGAPGAPGLSQRCAPLRRTLPINWGVTPRRPQRAGRFAARSRAAIEEHLLPPASKLLALACAAALAMNRAQVREHLSRTARICPQSRSASWACLPLTCAPAPDIHVNVGDPSAVHRRLLTRRLAFCVQVNSGRWGPFIQEDNATGNRRRQGGAARGSPRAAWARDGAGGLLG